MLTSLHPRTLLSGLAGVALLGLLLPPRSAGPGFVREGGATVQAPGDSLAAAAAAEDDDDTDLPESAPDTDLPEPPSVVRPVASRCAWTGERHGRPRRVAAPARLDRGPPSPAA